MANAYFRDWLGSDRSGPECAPVFTDASVAISEANHRISNNLSLLASLISLRASSVVQNPDGLTTAEFSAILHEISARIVAVGQVHRLVSVRPDAEWVNLDGYLSDLSRTIVAALADKGKVELVPGAADRCEVRSEQLLPLCLIVTEVLTNSLKYAHPSGVNGKLMVGCSRRGDGTTVISIDDDGVGLPEDFDFAADGGIGTRTIRALASQLGAEYAYKSGPIGLSFELRLPAMA